MLLSVMISVVTLSTLSETCPLITLHWQHQETETFGFSKHFWQQSCDRQLQLHNITLSIYNTEYLICTIMQYCYNVLYPMTFTKSNTMISTKLSQKIVDWPEFIGYLDCLHRNMISTQLWTMISGFEALICSINAFWSNSIKYLSHFLP